MITFNGSKTAIALKEIIDENKFDYYWLNQQCTGATNQLCQRSHYNIRKIWGTFELRLQIVICEF